MYKIYCVIDMAFIYEFNVQNYSQVNERKAVLNYFGCVCMVVQIDLVFEDWRIIGVFVVIILGRGNLIFDDIGILEKVFSWTTIN